MRRTQKPSPTDCGPRRARRPRFEEIEPRILYSADLSPAMLDTAALLPAAEHRVLDDAGEYITLQRQDQVLYRDEMVFVDTRVPEYVTLIRDMQRQQDDGRRLEIVLIDSQSDGIEQISNALAGRRDVNAVHIVSHGSDGEVQLGTARLDFDSLLRNAGRIKRWGDALAANADLLVYGCDVAASDAGRGLIDALARLTGADVAASEDPTGSRSEGGDWDLEYWVGLLDAPIAVSDQGRVSWSGLLAGDADAVAPHPLASAAATAEVAAASIPLAFQRNDGQTDAAVDFLARGSGYAVWLADGDAVIDLRNDGRAHTIRLGVLGGSTQAAASGESPLAGKSNYLIGAQDQWRQDIDNYAAVRYEEVYDGIDLRYYGSQRQLEYDFLLDPGANVADIRLGFEGVQGVSVAENGDLVLDLGNDQNVLFKAPVSYQDGPQGREAVDSRYVLLGDGSVGFELGAYDATRALIIDPVFSYGTYLGGTGADEILGMAVDNAGYVYLTGYTGSSTFPTTAEAFRTTDLSGMDVFVTKLTPDLSAMVYSTYLGGGSEEVANNIAVDSAGNAYITGYTKSGDFPVMSSYQATLSGSQDVFVTKLNITGDALVYSTYLGGNGGSDAGYSIAVDGAGSAYVSGYATSANFPTTAGAVDTSYNNGEGFVTKFSSDGSALLYSTFIGGGNFDAAYSVAIDMSGNAAVVGETQSTDFPVTASAYQTALASGRDIFVAKLNAAGTAFTYATYLGGNNDDQGLGAAVHASGKIYVTGYTSSNNFDVTAGALQPTDGGSGDAFLSVVDPSASGAASLVYSTYLGGSKNNEQAWAIAVDSAGRAYVAGSTDSDNFPTTSGAYRTTRAGSDDAFLVQINPVGGGTSDLLYGTYFGGNNADTAFTVAYSNGKVYFGGSTDSTGPAGSIATAGTVGAVHNGGVDGFAAVFTFATPPVVTVSATPLAYTEGAGPQPLDTTLTVSDPDSATLDGATVRITANYVVGEDMLAFTSQAGITGVFSAASGTLTLTGTSSVANYQAALRSVAYANTRDKPSTLTRSITITANDGTLGSAPVVRQVSVTSLNDVPQISAPSPQLVDEDATLIFSTGNPIVVLDVDAGTSDVEITLTATNGTLMLPTTAGLTVVAGTGTGDASMTFTGSIASINAALDGLRFDPTPDYNGSASVQVVMSDLGNTGSPGPQTANKLINVTVNPVNDAPTVSAITDQTIDHDTSLAPVPFTVGDNESSPGALVVSATSSNQTLVPNANLVIGGSGANRSIALTPAAGQWGSTTITVSVSDGGLITAQSFVLTVNRNNLPPAVVNATFTVQENAANGTAVGTVTATDPDPADSFSKIYWADYFDNSILRANLDGSDSETLVAGLSDPVAVAVDYVHGKIYWADSGSSKIQRANLDGTDVQDVVASGLSYPLSIEVDPDAGKIYWVDNTTRKIQRANLDGTGIQDIVVGLSSPTAIDLDLTAGKIYWVDDGTDRVQRANLDGSGMETLVTGLNNAKSIEVDVSNGNMYWVDLGILTSHIGTANLDGSGAVFDFIPVSNGTNGLAVDSSRGQLYWTENDLNNCIRRANLDGTGVITVLSTGLPLLSDPAGIALGPAMQGLSYAIVGGNTDGAFAIDAKTGALTVANGSALNLEATPSHALLIQVQDAGGMSTTAPMTVNLINLNEPPSAITPGSVVVDEGIDTSAGYTVATLATTDVDAGDPHTYSIVGGADAVKFSIAGDQLRIADGILDYETKPSYQVTVRSTDLGGLTVDQTVVLAMLNVNEAPTVSPLSNVTITEDGAFSMAFFVGDPEAAAGSLIVTATSSDTGLIPSGNLVLSGGGTNRGILVTPAPNAYGGPVTVTVSVSDGVNTTLETFDVTMAPVADHLLVVDTAADVADGDTSSIDALLMTKGADGFISLREAIIAANNSLNDAGGPDRIHFNIPGAGLHTIDVLSALPTLSDAVIIDGTSEPGFGGAPLIELNGVSAGTAADGLRITAGDSTVRGLVINRFGRSGIFVSGGGNNTIQGNYIGVDSAGNADLGNRAYGIRLASDSNLVGGTAPGDRNVISGNDIDGVYVAGSSGNVIHGNYIGTNAAGTGAVRNEEDGIWLEDASDNTIGGTTPGARNLISGNAWSGIALTGSGTGNVIQGNYIGIDASGAAGLANLRHGVALYGAVDTLIGGTLADTGNVIAYNGQAGVAITAGTGHTVLGNSIFGNGGLGIDIDYDGVSANDIGDGDLGTNLQTNAPVIYSVVVAGGNVTVTGEARPDASVELFKAAADPSGYGEGQTFIGSAVVSGAAPGVVDPTATRFSYTFAAGALVVGDWITATATDAGGNSSEFSLNVVASVLGPGVIVVPSSGLTTAEDGGSAAFSVVLSTQPTADVTIALSSSDTTEGTVTPASLTFTTANWNVAQTVAVTGVPDFSNDADVAYTIVLSATASADPSYQGIDPADVAVTNLDVNDLPLGTSRTKTGVEDVPVALSATDFTGGFSDVDGDSLAGIQIVSLPVNASLKLSGAPVGLNDVVPAARLGDLVLVPDADWAGTTGFAWLAYDGTGYSAASADIVLSITAVNDAPVLAVHAGASVAAGAAVTIDSGVLRVTDPDDTPAQLVYTVTTLPAAGMLYLAGAPVALNGTFTQADIDNGRLSYQHAGAAADLDGFSFTIADASGASAGTASFDVSLVTAPPPPPPVIIALATGSAPAPTPVGTGAGGGSGSAADFSASTDASEPASSLESNSDTSASPSASPDSPAGDALVAAVLNTPSSRLTPVASGLLIDASAQRASVAQLAPENGATRILRGGERGTTTVVQANAPEAVLSVLSARGPGLQRVQIASLETMTRTLTNAAWVGELDVMREQIGGKIQVESKLVASSVAVSGGLSVGYVIWLLRGGLLVSSLLSSLPAWHAVDPMPVLARSRNSDDEKGAEEDPLERLFGRAKDALLGGFGGRRAAERASAATGAEGAGRGEARHSTLEANG